MFKILVVEDDRELNRTVCSFLNHSGYEATGCMNAEDAFDAMYSTVFDLVVSDIMMPDVDGFEFAKEVRGTNADIPCSVNVSFSESHNLVGCFNGHTHYDTLRTIDGITYVSILNSQCGAYSDAPTRTDGTYTKIAYDVITVVPEESKVYLTRFGAGDSREFTY
jgi:CheY-like chemotaxis protein